MNTAVALVYLGLVCTPDCRTFCAVTVTHIYDGDTIHVDIDGVPPVFGKDMPVRMLGVDAPEMDSKDACEAKKAIEARELTKTLLSKAKKVDLQLVARDKYFRLLADIVADGYSVGQKLIDAKLAVGYNGQTKPKVDWCK